MLLSRLIKVFSSGWNRVGVGIEGALYICMC